MIRPKVYILCFCALMLMMTSCIKSRSLTSGDKTEMPPVTISNKAYVPQDQRPIDKTPGGFAPSNIPGVPPVPKTPHKYITYIGPST